MPATTCSPDDTHTGSPHSFRSCLCFHCVSTRRSSGGPDPARITVSVRQPLCPTKTRVLLLHGLVSLRLDLVSPRLGGGCALQPLPRKHVPGGTPYPGLPVPIDPLLQRVASLRPACLAFLSRLGVLEERRACSPPTLPLP